MKSYVIDIHNHLGILDADGHSLSAESMIKQMDLAGVDFAVVFPLDEMCRGPCYSIANEYLLEQAMKYERLIPFARIDPTEIDGCRYSILCRINDSSRIKCPYQEESLKRYKKSYGCMWTLEDELNNVIGKGIKGVKIHPRSQNFKLVDYDLLDPIMEIIKKNDLVLISHTQSHTRNIAKEFVYFANHYTDIPLIMGHSGMRNPESAIKISKKFDHVFFDLSINEPDHIEKLISEIPHERLLIGTDMPYRLMTKTLPVYNAVLEKLKLDTTSKEQILGLNAMRLLKLDG